MQSLVCRNHPASELDLRGTPSEGALAIRDPPIQGLWSVAQTVYGAGEGTARYAPELLALSPAEVGLPSDDFTDHYCFIAAVGRLVDMATHPERKA